MSRVIKCKRCGITLTANERVTHNGKSYCNDCCEIVKREATEYKELIKFICESFIITEPTSMILKQIKTYKTINNYTYAAMTYTLWYCKDILGKVMDVKYGVGLIPYFYNEAKEYYTQQESISNSVNKYKDLEPKVKIVKQNNSNEKKTNSLVNLESLLKGGDIN